jgi:hypothetical protein
MTIREFDKKVSKYWIKNKLYLFAFGFICGFLVGLVW